MSERNDLLRDVQTAEFALTEAGLFLDTHPNDQNALEYYRTFQKKHEKAVQAYIAVCGPLIAKQHEGDRWKWTDGPFPWERAANA